jgi:hypothetical protein
MIFSDAVQDFNQAKNASNLVYRLSTTAGQIAMPRSERDIQCRYHPDPAQSNINYAIFDAALAINLAVGADEQNTQY